MRGLRPPEIDPTSPSWRGCARRRARRAERFRAPAARPRTGPWRRDSRPSERRRSSKPGAGCPPSARIFAARFSCSQSWNRPRGQSSQGAGATCCSRAGRWLDPLAHMDYGSATKRLGAVDGVTALGIEFEIRREGLIGQQTNFRAPSLNCVTLGMIKQQAPKAPALLLRRYRDVLDPQVIGSQDRLDEAFERAALDEKVDCVLGDRALIVRLHRQRLSPDQRDPLGVGRARQIANSRRVLQESGPDFEISRRRCHRPDYGEAESFGKVVWRLASLQILFLRYGRLVVRQDAASPP